MTPPTPSTTTTTPALVFGASGEQGRAVMEGLVDAGYAPVYGFTSTSTPADVIYLEDALGCTVWPGDIANLDDVERALVETCAQAIFLVTTTDLPSEIGETTGCWNAMEAEYEVIQVFFQTLVKVHRQDNLKRHVIFSTKENVQKLCRENQNSPLKDIVPMDDGSIVPHYSAKGRGAEYALQLLKDYGNDGLMLTLLTLPFVYSNFLGFFTPLPVQDDDIATANVDATMSDTTTTKKERSVNQWQINASLGDGEKPLDMMSVSDLSIVVPHILEQPDKYNNKNIRLSACRVSMDQIAAAFSNLFGKDVIYNPLLPEEVAALPFPSAPAMAQMCHFLQLQQHSTTTSTTTDSHFNQHDIDMTREVMFPRQPQSFQDWLLTHSDSTAFVRVGLDLDAPDITSVVVFGATSLQGTSVVKGLLKDTRKQYTVRATTRHVDSPEASALKALDPDRVSIVYADFDDIQSCQAAADGVDGAFLVTDFYKDANRNMDTEEQHAKNVIDACEASSTIKHLVFSTMDNVEEMNRVMGLGMSTDTTDSQGQSSTLVQMDAKAKAAAYARTKKLSVTYVILPCYSEMFLDMIQRRPATASSNDSVDGNGSTTNNDNNNNNGKPRKEKLVLTVPLKNSNAKVMCMSVDDLGPAVSNIFDSYQVYAGHEIGLVTDFVTVSEIRDMLNAVILEDAATASGGVEGATTNATVIETRTVTKEDWIDMKENDTYMKDLGQMFAYLSHTDAVKKRHSIARTMKLVPSARPLKLWVEQNKDNPAFREKLGLR